jgi:glucose-1-phosphate cytidylyltransferase
MEFVMKAVILAGGLGTRLQEETNTKPKPMVEIGGQPILWHILNIFSTHGVNEFYIALGYKAEVIKNYFLNYYYLQDDITVRLHDGSVEVHNRNSEDWVIHLIHTGNNTQTGGRIKRLQPYLQGEPFFMTYGDGVADIDISKLLAFHQKNKKLATITAVRPPSRFGGMAFNGERVLSFSEKPQIGEGWINGGFFVLEPDVMEYIPGDQSSWEYEPINKLITENQLVAYQHDGFWQCMDTLRDVRLLETLWAEGKAPWKIW